MYKDATATMLIKVAGLVTVGDAKGEIMDKAETVTVFNDMCLMAPATFIDKRIKWEKIDQLIVKGTLNNNGVKISAVLYFNKKGELVNFVSNDRYIQHQGTITKMLLGLLLLANIKNITVLSLLRTERHTGACLKGIFIMVKST